MGDKMKVAIRIRPLNVKELSEELPLHWKSKDNTIFQVDPVSGRPKNDAFAFDHVFNEFNSTSEIFNAVVKPILDASMEGFNATVFAYGQTSSGKTFTMSGTLNDLGIIPLAVNYMFYSIENTPGREFLLRVSYMEIYNEKVNDLLEIKNTNRRVYEGLNGQVLVDVEERVCKSTKEVMDIKFKGDKNRHIGETNMNERSSRSHTIFKMILESRSTEDGEDGAVKISHVNLVDLAGSERASQSGATGDRFKEGCAINSSLTVLGIVINQLSEGQEGFVNYRDSKLTRLLQSSLGGNANTAMICAVTPAAEDQTQNTINFALRAKKIRISPKLNEDLSEAALIKRYARQIAVLNKELEDLKNKNINMEVQKMEYKLREKDEANERLQYRINKLKEVLLVSSSSPIQKLDKARSRARRRTWGGRNDPRVFSMFSSLNTIEEDTVMFPLSPQAHSTCVNEVPFETFERDLLKNNSEWNDNLEHEGEQSESTFMPEMSTDAQISDINKTLVNKASSVGMATPPSVLRARINSMSDHLNSVIQEYNELREYTTLEKQILCECKEMKKELNDIKDMNISLESRLEDKMLAYNELEQKYTELMQKNETLRLETEANKHLECKEMKKELNDIKDMNISLESQLEDKMLAYNELEQKYKELMQKNETLQLETEANNHLEERLEEMKKRYLDLEVTMDLKEQKFLARQTELEGELQNAWKSLDRGGQCSLFQEKEQTPVTPRKRLCGRRSYVGSTHITQNVVCKNNLKNSVTKLTSDIQELEKEYLLKQDSLKAKISMLKKELEERNKDDSIINELITLVEKEIGFSKGKEVDILNKLLQDFKECKTKFDDLSRECEESKFSVNILNDVQLLLRGEQELINLEEVKNIICNLLETKHKYNEMKKYFDSVKLQEELIEKLRTLLSSWIEKEISAEEIEDIVKDAISNSKKAGRMKELLTEKNKLFNNEIEDLKNCNEEKEKLIEQYKKEIEEMKNFLCEKKILEECCKKDMELMKNCNDEQKSLIDKIIYIVGESAEPQKDIVSSVMQLKRDLADHKKYKIIVDDLFCELHDLNKDLTKDTIKNFVKELKDKINHLSDSFKVYKDVVDDIAQSLQDGEDSIKIEELKNVVTDLKESNVTLQTNSTTKQLEYNDTLKELKTQIKKLESEIEENYSSKEILLDLCKTFQDGEISVKDLKFTFTNLQENNKELKKKHDSVNNEEKAKIEEVESLRSKTEKLKKEVEEKEIQYKGEIILLNEKLNQQNQNLESVRNEFSKLNDLSAKLQRDLSVREAMLDSLRNEIEDLRNCNEEKEKLIEQYKKEIEEMKNFLCEKKILEECCKKDMELMKNCNDEQKSLIDKIIYIVGESAEPQKDIVSSVMRLKRDLADHKKYKIIVDDLFCELHDLNKDLTKDTIKNFVKELKDKINHLSDSFKVYKDVVDDIAQSLQDGEDSIKIEELKNVVTDLKESNVTLQTNSTTKQLEYNDTLKELKTQIKKLESEIEENYSSKEILLDLCKTFQDGEISVKDLKFTFTNLQENNKELKKKHDSVNNEEKAKVEEVESLRSKIEKLKKEVEEKEIQYKGEIILLNEKLNQQNQNLESVRNEFSKLKDLSAKLQRDLSVREAMLDSLRNEIENYKTSENILSDLCCVLKDDAGENIALSEITDTVRKLQNDLQNYRMKNSEDAKQKEEIQRLLSEVDCLKMYKDIINELSVIMEVESNNLKTAVVEVTKERNALNIQLKEKESEYKSEIDNFKVELSKNSYFENIVHEIELIIQNGDESVDLKTAIENLKEQNYKLNLLNVSYTETIKQLKDDIELLQEELNTSKEFQYVIKDLNDIVHGEQLISLPQLKDAVLSLKLENQELNSEIEEIKTTKKIEIDAFKNKLESYVECVDIVFNLCSILKDKEGKSVNKHEIKDCLIGLIKQNSDLNDQLAQLKAVSSDSISKCEIERLANKVKQLEEFETLVHRIRALVTDIACKEITMDEIYDFLHYIHNKNVKLEKQIKEDALEMKQKYDNEISNLENRIQSSKENETILNDLCNIFSNDDNNTVMKNELNNCVSSVKKTAAELQNKVCEIQKSYSELESKYQEQYNMLASETSLKKKFANIINEIKLVLSQNCNKEFKDNEVIESLDEIVKEIKNKLEENVNLKNTFEKIKDDLEAEENVSDFVHELKVKVSSLQVEIDGLALIKIEHKKCEDFYTNLCEILNVDNCATSFDELCNTIQQLKQNSVSISEKLTVMEEKHEDLLRKLSSTYEEVKNVNEASNINKDVLNKLASILELDSFDTDKLVDSITVLKSENRNLVEKLQLMLNDAKSKIAVYEENEKKIWCIVNDIGTEQTEDIIQACMEVKSRFLALKQQVDPDKEKDLEMAICKLKKKNLELEKLYDSVDDLSKKILTEIKNLKPNFDTKNCKESSPIQLFDDFMGIIIEKQTEVVACFRDDYDKEKQKLVDCLKQAKNEKARTEQWSQQLESDITNLTQDINAKDKKIDALETKIKDLKQDSLDKAEEYSMIKKKLLETECDASTLRTEVDILQNNIDKINKTKIESQHEELLKELKNKEKQFLVLNEEISEKSYQIKKLQESVSTKDSEIKRMSEDLCDFKNQYEKQENTIKAFEKTKKSLQNEILTLKNTCEKKTSECMEQMRSLSNLNCEYVEVKKKLESNCEESYLIESRFDEVKKELESTKAVLKDLLVSIESEKVQKDHDRINLLSEKEEKSQLCEKLTEKLSALTKEHEIAAEMDRQKIKILETKIDLLESEIKDYKELINVKNQEISKIQNCMKHREKQYNELECNLKAKISSHSDAVSKLNSVLSEREEQLRVVQQTNGDLIRKLGQVKEVENDNEQLLKQISLHLEKISQIQSELLDKETLITSLRKEKDQLQKDIECNKLLMKQKEQEFSNMEELHKESSKKLEDYKNLENSHTKLTELMNRLKTDLLKKENEVVELEKQSKELMKHSQVVEADLKYEKQQSKVLKMKNETLASKLSQKENILTEKLPPNSQLDNIRSAEMLRKFEKELFSIFETPPESKEIAFKMIRNKMEEVKKLEEKLMEAEADKKELDNECENMDSHIKYLENEMIDVKVKLEKEAEINTDLKKSIDRLNKDLSWHKVEIDKLEQNIRELRENRRSLMSKLRDVPGQDMGTPSSEFRNLKQKWEHVAKSTPCKECSKCDELIKNTQLLKEELDEKSKKIVMLEIKNENFPYKQKAAHLEESLNEAKTTIMQLKQEVRRLQSCLHEVTILRECDTCRNKKLAATVQAYAQTSPVPESTDGENIVQKNCYLLLKQKYAKLERETVLLKRLCRDRSKTIDKLELELKSLKPN